MAAYGHGVARTLVHPARRVRGAVGSRRVDVDGTAPAAVVAAVRRATWGRPDPDERVWVAAIEARRRALSASTEPVDIVDHGAGRRSGTPARTVGQATMASKPPRWAYLLFRLARALRPASVVELGSCVGISAAYQAAALAMNGGGTLVTLEGAPALAARTAETLDGLGLSARARVVEGRFADTLDGVLAGAAPVGLAFVDGHHVGSATLDYAERILAATAPEAVLVFDDIAWSPDMAAAWRALAADPRFALTLDLRTVGIAAVSATATRPVHRALPYG